MLGRVRVANKFPDVKARMQPSDSLASLSRGFGSPRQRPTSMQELVLNRLRMLLPTRSASETDHRLSERPVCSRKGEDLPGYWAVLFVRAVMQHPAGRDPSWPLLLFEKIYGEVSIAFAKNRTLGIRNEYSFRSHLPTAHTLAYLRFADLVTDTLARLATGSGGLTPGRAGFAPAGRQTKFHGVIAIPPIPIDRQSLVALNVLSPNAVDLARVSFAEPWG